MEICCECKKKVTYSEILIYKNCYNKKNKFLIENCAKQKMSLDKLMGDEMIATGIMLPRIPKKPQKPQITKKPILTKH